MSEADDATLPDTSAPTGGRATSIRASFAELGGRYDVGDVLGRGGMGEVRIAQDKRINRKVAVKLMRESGADDAMLARFFREAHVQGMLDHPAIVPVHDLGIDAEGNPYFVMKSLAGTTLADVLVSEDPTVRAEWPRRKLLARLVDICLAIEFAHSRNVIHRDLKPANIMLGKYGEAYVLDWGLARAVGDTRIEGDSLRGSVDRTDNTQVGELLGTPGYMSPEQARGEEVDARTDVFSLGCVLYEILVGTPALPRGLAAIHVTQDLVEALKPSDRSPDVPFELDRLCTEATASDRTARPTAGALADGIQAYLDGDRDLAQRKRLATEKATAAKVALDEALAGAVKGEALNTVRATAMRDAARAIALDPENATALDILSYLRQQPPDTIPVEALAAADHERALARQQVIKWARSAIAMLIAIEVVVLFVPLHHVWPVLLMLGFSIPALILTQLMSVRPLPMVSPYFPAFLLFIVLAIGAAGIVVGPLFVMPILIIGAISGFLAQPTAYSPWMVVVALQTPIVILIALESAGVLPSTFELRDGSFVIKTWVFDLTPTIAILLLASTIIVQTINSTMVAVFQRRAQETAQNRVHAHQWHLEQLLPKQRDQSGG